MSFDNLAHFYNFNSIHYLPIHLNIIRDTDFQADIISPNVVHAIFNYFKQNEKSDLYFIDFNRISSGGKSFSEEMAKFNDYNIALINLNDSSGLYSKISENECKDLFKKSDIGLLTENFQDRFEGKKDVPHFNLDSINNWFANNKKQEIVRFYRNNIKTLEEFTFLASSGVYANMYFNIKDLFYKPKLFSLVTYLLCEKLNDIQDEYILISASNTGGALANVLGKLMKKDVCFLRNLGPKASVKDRHLFDNITYDESYVFIYDFLCLGSELRLTEMLLKLKQSRIINAFGVADYRNSTALGNTSNKGINCFSIFNVKTEGFLYEVKVEI